MVTDSWFLVACCVLLVLCYLCLIIITLLYSMAPLQFGHKGRCASLTEAEREANLVQFTAICIHSSA